MPEFDVVGVGLNATDTLLVVPRFPAYAGKVPFEDEVMSPGGQVASAMVACARLGLRTRYIGTVGDDIRGEIQLASLREAGINLDYVQIRHGPNQSAYIIIDRSTGERTVLWRRPDCLRIDPEEIAPAQITCARLLHIDGHDTPAVEHAARIAHGAGIPVTVDVDTIYHGFDRVLPYVDYLIASSEFPVQWTNESDPFKALCHDSAGIRHAGGRHDAGRARLAGARKRALHLLARLRGQLCGYDRRGRRLPWGLLLCFVTGNGHARSSRFLQRHGGPQLYGAGSARRHRHLEAKWPNCRGRLRVASTPNLTRAPLPRSLDVNVPSQRRTAQLFAAGGDDFPHHRST